MCESSRNFPLTDDPVAAGAQLGCCRDPADANCSVTNSLSVGMTIRIGIEVL